MWLWQRETEDVATRKLIAQSKADQEKWLAAIQLTLTQLGVGAQALLTDHLFEVAVAVVSVALGYDTRGRSAHAAPSQHVSVTHIRNAWTCVLSPVDLHAACSCLESWFRSSALKFSGGLRSRSWFGRRPAVACGTTCGRSCRQR